MTQLSRQQLDMLARTTVKRFVGRFDERYHLLAYYAALPLVLTPELLNLLNTRFLRGQVPWEAEADLLLSDLCQEVGYEQYLMQPSVRSYLQREARRKLGTKRIAEVGRVLLHYAADLYRANPFVGRGEMEAQRWAAMVYLDDQRDMAVSQIAEALRRAVEAVASNDQALAQQAEIARLVRITLLLTPQLQNQYPELLRYVELLTQALANPEDQLQRPSRPVRVLGITLPSPDTLVERAQPVRRPAQRIAPTGIPSAEAVGQPTVQQDDPLREYRERLRELGTYFTNVLPSNVDQKLFIETETFLNDLYLRDIDVKDRTSLKVAINRTLAQASALVKDLVRGSYRSPEFFKSIKNLGEELLRLADMFETVQVDTLDPLDAAAVSDAPIQSVDFLIITSLAEEHDAVLTKLPGFRRQAPSATDSQVYYLADLPIRLPDGTNGSYRIVVLTLLVMGRVQSVVSITDAIQRWNPRYLLLVGIAGGIAENDAALGDVLVSNQVVDYELQKLTAEGENFRHSVHRVDPRLLEAALHLADDAWRKLVKRKRPVPGSPRRLIGPIATGDRVIAVKPALDKYRDDWPKLIGIEMEASGAAIAAFRAAEQPGFFVVRGVSDLADEQKSSANVEQWRGYACDVAASYAIALLQSGPVPIDSHQTLQLGREDILKLIDLMLRSGLVSLNSRSAFCLQIGVDPNALAISSRPDRDFALEFVDRLVKSDNNEALRQLCDVLAPRLRGHYQDEIAQIRAKIT